MKRYVLVLALACALVLAIGMGSARAGILPIPNPMPPSGPPSGSGQNGSQSQTVDNSTEQKNVAIAVSPTVAALNNLALINKGDQTTVAGTSQSQGNANSTDQTAVQAADQDQSTGSGQGGQQWKSGSSSAPSSSGASQHLDQDQKVKNETDQKNVAIAVSPTVAVGNNLAGINKGDQTTVAGTSQSQGNGNGTDQTAVQTADQDQNAGSGKGGQEWKSGSSSAPSSSGASQHLDQDQKVKNETDQKNEALAISPTVAALNNLALINKGDQTTVAGTSQSQGNANWTDQTAIQKADQEQQGGSAPARPHEQGGWKDKGGEQCRCDEHPQVPPHPQGSSQQLHQEQTVKNDTHQKNVAIAVSPTLAVGNNLALINKGDQTTVAGTSQQQGNWNGTEQKAVQKADQEQHGTPAPGRPQKQGGFENGNTCHEQPVPVLLPNPPGDECGPNGEQHSGQNLHQRQTVKNDTHQKNVAFAVSPTVAGLNNLALINKGDQTTVAGTSQSQGNANWTKQKAIQKADQDQQGGSGSSYPHEPGGSNDPVNCHEQQMLLPGGDCRPEEHPVPGQNLDQEQKVKNETHQKNEAFAVSPTLALGNNLAGINKGDQTTVAGTSQSQGNANWTKQTAIQKADQEQHGAPAPGRPEKGGRKGDSCHEQPQMPERTQGKDECRPQDEPHSAPAQHLDQEQTVKNETQQKNVAFAFSPTVAALNNLALLNCGDQTTVAGTSQQQGNWNATGQWAFQGASQRS